MNDNIHSLAGAYAVDAVSEAEREAFEAHLATCEDCLLEVASMGAAVDEMASAYEVAPPEDLKSQVMAEVRRTPQAAAEPAAHAATLPVDASTADVWTADASTADTAANDATGDDAPGDELAARRKRRARRTWAVSGVAAASAVVLTFAGVTWNQARDDRAAELALEKEVMTVATAPDATSMDMDLGVGHVVSSDRMDSVAVVGSSAPMPDKGTEYQLWLVLTDGTAVAGPTFIPEDGQYMVVTDGDMQNVAAVAVTVEPKGGSEQPTSDPISVTEMPTKA